MKITISSPAIVCDDLDDEVVDDLSIFKSLDGRVYGDESDDVACYLAPELADIGIIGGSTRYSYDSSSGLVLHTDYWSHRELTADEVDKLTQETVAQWEDGIGENGFPFEFDGEDFYVTADLEAKSVSALQISDSRVVPPPSRIAISARDGNMNGLTAAIAAGEDVDGEIQGVSALQLAVLYGHVDAALMLIERGADVNKPDSSGDRPLHACALSNSLSDEESTKLALSLMEKGANLGEFAQEGGRAIYYAEDRGKLKLKQALEGAN